MDIICINKRVCLVLFFDFSLFFINNRSPKNGNSNKYETIFTKCTEVSGSLYSLALKHGATPRIYQKPPDDLPPGGALTLMDDRLGEVRAESKSGVSG